MPMFTIELDLMTCPAESCGIKYGLDSRFRDERLKDGKSWHCPNGHSLSYHNNSEIDKLKAAKLTLESQLQFARDQRDRMEKKFEHQKIETRTQKGRATRFKNDRDRILARIANGVYPCCNRHFVNVERHMKVKHPKFVIPDADE